MEASDSERRREMRREHLMRLWRGVSKAVPRLIRAQQRAAERVFAPGGDCYSLAWSSFLSFARVEALASPVHLAKALASVTSEALVYRRQSQQPAAAAAAADDDNEKAEAESAHTVSIV